MNLALLAKQAYRILQQPNALWVQILKVVCFPTVQIFSAKKERGFSWIWASLLMERDFLKANGKWHVGDGTS